MERTITIEGTASITAKPDWIKIVISIFGEAKKYQDAVSLADEKIKSVTDELVSIGFEKKGIKTSHFAVNPQYNFHTDRKNRMKREFSGYKCSHDLIIEFDFDSCMLGKALSTITFGETNPQLSIAFTLKDKETIIDTLLEKATKNAKKRAELMCTAAGSALGNLVKVDYNLIDNNIYSKQCININDTCELAMPTAAMLQTDIQPNDIIISESATFVWAIN